MNFEQFDLDPRLLHALKRQLIKIPTPIQAAAIPVALAGEDVVGTARTGTGKTLAFALPMIQRLLNHPPKGRGKTRALILAPTRELATQINAVFQQLLPGLKLRSAVVFGGVGFRPQEEALRGGVEIIVACPGRLLDHMESRIADLSMLEILVLDEADQMFDMGFLPNLRRIVSKLPDDRQSMLFSATFAPELSHFIREIADNPQKVSAGVDQAAQTVEHALFPVAHHLKTDLLVRLMEEESEGTILIFTRTKHRANRISEKLARAGWKNGVLHSNKSQNHRQRTLDEFRSGALRILVATDIAARGIDVNGITHVINFDIPETATTYIHRIGRTGRAEREGDAYTLVSPDDAQTVREVERKLGKTIERRTIPGFAYDAPPQHNQGPNVDDREREGGGGGGGFRGSRGPRRSGGGSGGGHRGGGHSSGGSSSGRGGNRGGGGRGR